MAGKWKITIPPEMAKLAGGVPDSYMELNADGTFVMKGTLGGKDLGTQDGTWKAEGEKMTLTLTHIQGKPVDSTNAKPVEVVLASDHKSFDFMGLKFTKV